MQGRTEMETQKETCLRFSFAQEAPMPSQMQLTKSRKLESSRMSA